MSQPLAIITGGLVSPVGYNARTSCAAMRCRYECFAETEFTAKGAQEKQLGSAVEYNDHVRGTEKLERMCINAINELFSTVKNLSPQLPMIICGPEAKRVHFSSYLIRELASNVCAEIDELSHTLLHHSDDGRTGIVHGIEKARELLEKHPQVLVLTVDSLLNPHDIAYYGPTAANPLGRLLTDKNSDGFIPGEAAAAFIVTRTANTQGHSHLLCHGTGLAQEEAVVGTGQVNKGVGLAAAIQAAEQHSELKVADTQFRLSSVSGESFYFNESALALHRVMKAKKDEYEQWSIADQLGEIGAATGGAALTFLHDACAKGYAPGNQILMHLSADGSERAALLLSYPSAA